MKLILMKSITRIHSLRLFLLWLSIAIGSPISNILANENFELINIRQVTDGTILLPNMRYNNPGAQWPSKAHKAFGCRAYGEIKKFSKDGVRNRIAFFPNPTVGGAANMWHLANATWRNGTFIYKGKTVIDALKTWRGPGGTPLPPKGFSGNEIIDDAFLSNQDNMVRFFRGKSSHEGAGNVVLTDDQWVKAFKIYKDGKYTPTQLEEAEVDYYIHDYKARIKKIKEVQGDPSKAWEYEYGSKPVRLMTQEERELKLNPFIKNVETYSSLWSFNESTLGLMVLSRTERKLVNLETSKTVFLGESREGKYIGQFYGETGSTAPISISAQIRGGGSMIDLGEGQVITLKSSN